MNFKLCVGIDPAVERLPSLRQSQGTSGIIPFCQDIIAACAPYCHAFKFQFAYFAAVGLENELALLILKTKEQFPHHFIIFDGKRGDIGETSKYYAKEVYDRYQADACTLNPYMGHDVLDPFLEYHQKVNFILVRTSNQSSHYLQDQAATYAAKLCAQAPNQLGMVLGATHTKLLSSLAHLSPHSPLLIPGIGKQGGDLKGAMEALKGHPAPIFFSSSRDIIFASSNSDYAPQAANACKGLIDFMAKHTANSI